MFLKILIINLLGGFLLAIVLYTTQKDQGKAQKAYNALYKYALISNTLIVVIWLLKWVLKY